MSQLQSRMQGYVRQALILFPTLAAISLLWGCKGFFIGPSVTDVWITPSSPSILVSGTQQMIATAKFDDGTTGAVTDQASWTSSNTSVATVNATGLVKGIATGTATISATDQGYSGSTTVTVTTSNLVSLSITPTNTTLSSGQSQQYEAVGLLQDGTTTDMTSAVTWSSSNTAAATIDSSGLAVAKTVSSSTSTNIVAKSGSITSNTAVLTVE